jgi:tRNA U34 5-carboxymethylaminomethyl modifying enzyme MnmG/GidA
MVDSKVLVLDIVLLLKIKLIVLLIKRGISFFIEPEGWHTCEVYVNGFSTSLPEDIQFKALRSVVGFENVNFLDQGML